MQQDHRMYIPTYRLSHHAEAGRVEAGGMCIEPSMMNGGRWYKPCQFPVMPRRSDCLWIARKLNFRGVLWPMPICAGCDLMAVVLLSRFTQIQHAPANLRNIAVTNRCIPATSRIHH